jgi:hypothetical protein
VNRARCSAYLISQNVRHDNRCGRATMRYYSGEYDRQDHGSERLRLLQATPVALGPARPMPAVSREPRGPPSTHEARSWAGPRSPLGKALAGFSRCRRSAALRSLPQGRQVAPGAHKARLRHVARQTGLSLTAVRLGRFFGLLSIAVVEPVERESC